MNVIELDRDTVKEWLERAIKERDEATIRMRQFRHVSSAYEEYRDDVQYLGGRIDAYQDILRLAGQQPTEKQQ